jgi:signal transduction histidine kinase
MTRPEDDTPPEREAQPIEHRAFIPRIGSWAGNSVMAIRGTSASFGVATIALLMGIGWAGVYLAGGAGHAPPHWFYIPILIAAVRFGPAGAMVTALASGVIAGPLTPSDVASGTQQAASDEIIRAVFFVFIGGVMAAIIWRLEEALSREAELARREAELAAHKAAMISAVSHEFRTPLSVLLGSSKMLLLRKRDWSEVERTLLEGIAGSARRLNDLVAAVLAVAEGPLDAENPELRDAPLRQIVSAVVTAIDPREAERVTSEIGDEIVRTDPPILEALLRQLLDNALKFTPGQSAVEIGARVEQAGQLLIVVADRGPGFDPRFLSKAFEPFTQGDASTTRTSGGLGIGLFVARRLAEYLGGELELRRRPGGGTEACVSVPHVGSLALADRAPGAADQTELPTDRGRE